MKIFSINQQKEMYVFILLLINFTMAFHVWNLTVQCTYFKHTIITKGERIEGKKKAEVHILTIICSHISIYQLFIYVFLDGHSSMYF